jgi:integrase
MPGAARGGRRRRYRVEPAPDRDLGPGRLARTLASLQGGHGVAWAAEPPGLQDRDQWRRRRRSEGLEPRELRHSFVSLLSDNGVPLGEISRLVGHRSTAVTELVYRQQIRPVVQSGAVVMDRLFGAWQWLSPAT